MVLAVKKTACQNISPYLIDGRSVIAKPRAKSLNAPADMIYGSGIYSGGHLVLTEEDRDDLLAENSGNDRFIRPCIGGNEILNGIKRWVLWLYGSNGEWRKSAFIQNRIERCRQYRLSASRVRDFADKPWEFGELRQPESGMILALPKVSSDRRDYLPIVFVSHCVVVNASAVMMPNAEMMHFGILSSAMHSAWLSVAGGRCSTSWQYGCRNVYNTFPWPNLDNASQVESLAEEIFAVRKRHSEMSLGRMYSPEAMPADLKEVHAELDREVDRLYTPKRLYGTEDRLRCLFAEYSRLVQNKDSSIDQWC